MPEASVLNEREELILEAVVHMYVTTAGAVGSRAIVKRCNLDLCPATVRNVMADLEEAGYLQQLHTSSGRVPTDQGYRYFVDYLMGQQELSLSERGRIDREIAQYGENAEDVMRHASRTLASTSRQAGIVRAPAEAEAELRHIEIVQVAPSRLGVVLADSYGRVKTLVVTMEEAPRSEELGRLSGFLNAHLQGVTLGNFASGIQAKLDSYLDEQRKLAEQALRLLNLMPAYRPEELYLEGATHLFEQPEFCDVGRAREVFNLLAEQERLVQVLSRALSAASQGRALVVIGREGNVEGMEEVSLVASPYMVGEKVAGLVAVLGPRRMQYSRLTALVGYIADSLSRSLTRFAG
jgi:heat-inducible transcriptional repressor